jgi:BirA family transcriptional regulator, biotin operon repressor / biotin---[acetyl-CoA-carboxylase] ligase
VAVPLQDRLELFRALIAALADGGARSAGELARLCGRPEHEIPAALAELRALGVDVVELGGDAPGESRAREGPESGAAGRPGFRLAAPVELLDAARIRDTLDSGVRGRIAELAVFFAIDSTNTWLLARAPACEGSADAALAELQLAGRGRHGRAWSTPFGGSLALSLGRTFRDAARVDPSLSLAVGVAVARALLRQGARGIGLKWPNDVWFEGRKLGGILVELKTVAGGAGQVVIGVGLNLSLSADRRRAIEGGSARVAALADACQASPGRNALAAALLTALLSMLETYERQGFAAFREEWTSLDALAGRPVRVLVGDHAVEGVSRGVDADGALLVDGGGQLHRFVCGEASLRGGGDT